MIRIVETERYRDQMALAGAAKAAIECDLVIKNARIVDVVNEITFPGEIWIKNGVIVHVERKNVGHCRAKNVFDAKGAYAAPGLMDSHVHIESSMLSPYYFGRAVVVHGTTSVFTDPHEIVNVAGRAGFDYMYENNKTDPVIRQFMLIPSCVPAVPSLESAGAEIGRKDIIDLAGQYGDRVAGLAEVMDYFGIINGDPRMTDILDAARGEGLYLQSHYFGLHGQDMSAYLTAGLGGNHEIRDMEYMKEVLEAGGWVDMCGGSSIVDRLNELLPALKLFENPSILRVTYCTDDVHAKDLTLREHGHINKAVVRTIASGIKPETAIAYATRNVAAEYGIKNLGAIAPGMLADLIVFDDLKTIEPTAVFVNGFQMVAGGELTRAEEPKLAQPGKKPLLRTMNCKTLGSDNLVPRKKDGSSENGAAVNVIACGEGILTTLGRETLPLKDGRLDLSGRDDLCFIAVCNRYGSGDISLGVLKDFGLKEGAVATTISHDSHNLTVIYKDPGLAAYLANKLIECGGGVAAGAGKDKYALIELPIGGLMSLKSAEELTPEIEALEVMLARLFGEATLLLKTAILTLPVVPGARITNKGLVDVIKQTFVPLFV